MLRWGVHGTILGAPIAPQVGSFLGNYLRNYKSGLGAPSAPQISLVVVISFASTMLMMTCLRISLKWESNCPMLVHMQFRVSKAWGA